jgi:hypothetical protein
MHRGTYLALTALAAAALALVEADAGAGARWFGPHLVGVSYLAALLWLGVCAAFLRGWARGTPAQPDPIAPSRVPDHPGVDEMFGLGVVVILGVVFRRMQIDELPWGHAGIAIDAAYLSDIAFRILDGTQHFTAIMLSPAYYRDVMLPYWFAAFYGVFGRGIASLRLACLALSVASWVMLYMILRAHTRSLAVLLGVVALYAFWDADAILSASGVEYVVVTPIVLATLLLLRRALRTHDPRHAAVAGLVWGLGWFSYVAYCYLGLVPLLIVAIRRPRSAGWLRAFFSGGLLGGLPKLVSLVFMQDKYFHRALDVTRHDAQGHLLVWDALRGNAIVTFELLLREYPANKWMLMEPQLLSPPLVPLVVLGLVLCLRRPRVPDHLWTLGVTASSIAICVLTYPMDYRLANLLPAALLAAGIGLAWIGRLASHRPWFTWAVVLFVGWTALSSVARYFDVRPGPFFTTHYGAEEVALARTVTRMSWSGRVLIFAYDLTYRTVFFTPKHVDILRLNAGLDWETQHRFSERGMAIVLKNVAAATVGAAQGGHSIDVLIDPDSPYARRLVEHLVKDLGATLEEPLTLAAGRAARMRTLLHVRIPRSGAKRG